MCEKKGKSCLSWLVNWIIDRMGAEEFTSMIVWRHTLHPVYSLGGLTTLMFIIQAITGLILLIFYVPVFGETNLAYDSVVRISEEVAYGSIIRGLHFYAANLMILLAILHFLRVYFLGSYKRPHEITYIIGILTGLLAILDGVTGYSLRMDHIAGEAIRIGNTLVSSMPGGKILAQIIYGTGTFDEIVGRYLAYHILVAGLILILMLLHFFSVHQHHVSPPYDGSDPEPAVPFFPNHILTEAAAAFVIIGSLIVVAAVFPAELGLKFLPTEELPVGQPEWYLMALYAGIKTGVDPILAGVVVPGVILLTLVLMPWIDPVYSRHPKNRRIATVYGAILTGEFVVFTIYGMLTPGEQIPLINAIAVELIVAFVTGIPAARYTSKPVPPKKRQPIKRVRHRPLALEWAKYLFWVMVLIQAISLALGVQAHIEEMYNLAALYFGITIIAFGWAFFIGKILLFDAKYITKPVTPQ